METDRQSTLVEAIEEQLKMAHSQRGMDASDEDIKIMACCLEDMSACDVPKLFAKHIARIRFLLRGLLCLKGASIITKQKKRTVISLPQS